MGLLGNVFAKIARIHGFNVISDDEKWEAQRIGADMAREIYEPIFKSLKDRHVELNKIANNKQNTYDQIKIIIKNMYLEAQSMADKYEKKCKCKGINCSWKDASAMQGVDLLSDSLFIARGPVLKENVPEYKAAIRYGFEKIQKSFKKKIEIEENKIRAMEKAMNAFDKNSSEAFKSAIDLVIEETKRAEFYQALCKND